MAAAVLALAAMVVALLNGDGDKPSSDLAELQPPTSLYGKPFDVSDKAGCWAGDLAGFAVPRWLNVQAGFYDSAGTGFVQCSVARWATEEAAVAEFQYRISLMEQTMSSLEAQAISAITLSALDISHGAEEFKSFQERHVNGPERLVWFTIVRQGRYVGFIIFHSFLDEPSITRSDFDGLVDVVLRRIDALPK